MVEIRQFNLSRPIIAANAVKKTVGETQLIKQQIKTSERQGALYDRQSEAIDTNETRLARAEQDAIDMTGLGLAASVMDEINTLDDYNQMRHLVLESGISTKAADMLPKFTSDVDFMKANIKRRKEMFKVAGMPVADRERYWESKALLDANKKAGMKGGGGSKGRDDSLGWAKLAETKKQHEKDSQLKALEIKTELMTGKDKEKLARSKIPTYNSITQDNDFLYWDEAAFDEEVRMIRLKENISPAELNGYISKYGLDAGLFFKELKDTINESPQTQIQINNYQELFDSLDSLIGEHGITLDQAIQIIAPSTSQEAK